jgi:hypothetical protein
MGVPGNKGNRRTGVAKGSQSGTRRGQLPWREDPLILERIDRIRVARAQGKAQGLVHQEINVWLKGLKVPEVGIDTIKADYARIRELQQEEREAAAEFEAAAIQEHIDSLREIQRAAWDAFRTAGASSLNRSAYLNTIRAAEVDIGRFDRSLSERHEITGNKGGPVTFVLDIAEPND